MPFVTHFKDTDGNQLPIAASTLATVEIPAAGSADKGDWHQAAESTTAHYNQQAGHNAPKNSAVIPHCTDPSVFTDHGLRIEYEEQLQGWVLWIDSLPETACTLTLLFINHSTEGTPCVLPALGVGGGGGGFQMAEITLGVDTAEDFATVTAEKCAELDALKQAQMPILLKVIDPADEYSDNPRITVVDTCSVAIVGEQQFMFGGLNYVLINTEGIWILMQSPLSGGQNE